jgi:hypothetical protein
MPERQQQESSEVLRFPGLFVTLFGTGKGSLTESYKF